jgi:hypothetical protein
VSGAGAPWPVLHIPDEPSGQRDLWYVAVLDGTPLDEVVQGEGGVAEWLWRRWRVLERAGVSAKDFVTTVGGYRRELWLWLAGERTWAQCCSGLTGRLTRRFGS